MQPCLAVFDKDFYSSDNQRNIVCLLDLTVSPQKEKRSIPHSAGFNKKEIHFKGEKR
jgi:hypothetical protein